MLRRTVIALVMAFFCAAAVLPSQAEAAGKIGVANPMSVLVDTFGTGKVDDAVIAAAVNSVFDFRPAAIIDTLELRRPIYRQLAAYGHIGREDLGVVWERTDKVDALRTAAGI